MSKAQRISLVALLSSICTVSRVTLTFLPNIKPVTSIIIIVSSLYGPSLGIEVAVVTTLLSNTLLGMGPWTLYQIVAWSLIALLSGLLGKTKIGKDQHTQQALSVLAAYLFGFVVSLEKLLYSTPQAFLIYYISGLYFDSLHAIGNLIFYPICHKIITIAIRNK